MTPDAHVMHRLASMWTTGREIRDGYLILGRIGRGGVGVVHKAKEMATGRTVAIKSLLPRFVEDSKRRARFALEAEHLVRLAPHPNVVRAYTVIEAGYQPRLVCEYLSGGSLEHRASRKDLPIVDMLTAALQIASGVAYAHAQGLIHGDLTPSNVLFTSDGTAKVADFGQAIDEEPLTIPPEWGGRPQGTPAYLAPELWHGERPHATSDAWAFGCLLYRILTGAPPFPGDSGRGMVAIAFFRNAATTASPDDPRVRVPDLPEAVVDLMLRCLERDPSRRLSDFSRIGPEWLEPALSALGAIPRNPAKPDDAASKNNALEKAFALLRLGAARANIDGDILGANALFSEAEQAFSELNYGAGIARVACAKAELIRKSGDRASELTEFSRALRIAEATKDASLIGDVLKRMGSAYYYMKDYVHADQCYRQSLELAEASDDQILLAKNLHNLAGIAVNRGEFGPALALYRRASEIDRRFGYIDDFARGVFNMARLFMRTGRVRRALAAFERAGLIAGRLGDLQTRSASLTNASVAHYCLGDFSAALRLCRAALEEKRALGDLVGQCRCLSNISYMLADSGEAEEALGAACEALAICERTGNSADDSDARLARAYALHALGDTSDAETAYRDIVTGPSACTDANVIAGASIGLAECMVCHGDFTNALEWAEHGLTKALCLGIPYQICDAYFAVAVARESAGLIAPALDAARRGTALMRRVSYYKLTRMKDVVERLSAIRIGSSKQAFEEQG